MESFIVKKNKLNDEQINELLYYYKQGIDIGKEEATLTIINNLINLNIDLNTISNATNISINKIKQLLD